MNACCSRVRATLQRIYFFNENYARKGTIDFWNEQKKWHEQRLHACSAMQHLRGVRKASKQRD
jgi:hypothetical protein